MKSFLFYWNYFYFICITVLIVTIVSVVICGVCFWAAELNRKAEIQEAQIHDRVATPEELAYYKRLEQERKKKEELKSNPIRAVIDTNKGLSFSQGVCNFNGLRETWYGRSAGRLVGTENFHSVNGWYLDTDNYYVIACGDSICPKGGVIETSKGPAKRYDTCPTPKTIDFYVDK